MFRRRILERTHRALLQNLLLPCAQWMHRLPRLPEPFSHSRGSRVRANRQDVAQPHIVRRKPWVHFQSHPARTTVLRAIPAVREQRIQQQQGPQRPKNPFVAEVATEHVFALFSRPPFRRANGIHFSVAQCQPECFVYPHIGGPPLTAADDLSRRIFPNPFGTGTRTRPNPNGLGRAIGGEAHWILFGERHVVIRKGL